jgi:tetratricopeptide (TPR) repeat protein
LLALTDGERTLLAQAASIGREFWTGALVALMRERAPMGNPKDIDFLGGASIDEMRAQLERFVEQRILEPRSSRLRGEECFGFRTNAHWQAALEGLPTTTRQDYHRVILAWLQRQSEALRSAGDNDSALERELARHAEAAGLTAEAALHHHRAARFALAEGHSRAALGSLEDGLRLVNPEQIALRLDLMADIAEVYRLLGTTGLAHEASDRALELAWRLGDRRTAARVLSQLAELEAGTGEHLLARKYLVQALRIHEVLQDPRGIASGSMQLGRWYWQLGDFDKALMCFRKAEHIYQQLSDLHGIAHVNHALGAVHYDRGDIADAQAFYEEALRLRRELDDKRGAAKTLNNLAAVWMSRRLERSVQLWEEAFDMAREMGDLGMQSSIANNLGEVLMLLERREDARQMLQRAVELAELTGHRAVLVDALRNQGVLHQREGAFEVARGLFQRAAEEAARLGVLRLQALVARALGDLELAVIHASGSIGGDERGGSLVDAERFFVAAAHDFEAGRYDLEAADTLERLAHVLALAGRAAEAHATEDRAAAFRAAHTREVRAEPPPLPAR